MLTRILFLFLSLLIVMTSVDKNAFAQQQPPIEPGVSRELARWRAANYSDVRYKLNLTLEKMSPVLKGSIEISLKNDAGQIVLDWRKIKGKEQFSSVSNVQINGSAAKFEERDEHLVFKEAVKAGENVIKLDFTSPIATSGAAVTRYVDKEDGAEYIYSLFVPSDASTAFPVFDQPDLKARFKLNLLSPFGWKTISNTDGKSTDVFDEADKSNFKFPKQQETDFAETQPISTYVFAFASGEFNVFSESDFSKQLTEYREPRIKRKARFARDIDPKASQNVINIYEAEEGSEIYVRKSQAEKFKQHAAEVFRLNREGVKFLESYFDYKFPFPKYDLVLIPEFPFGGMEHAGATFLRESSIIFPSEPTANDYISRGNLIFHEAAHQWFGDTVTMRWFDDLWLKEGFAEFMAYKTMEKVLPQYNAWKAFYERNKPLAYLTDSTRGTTPIYQEIPNLSAAKSAYGNIVYRKAPAFLRQAEFYLGADKFQTAVRAFLKQNAFKNAEWQDLVKSFETASGEDLKDWANVWVKQKGLPIIKVGTRELSSKSANYSSLDRAYFLEQSNNFGFDGYWSESIKVLLIFRNEQPEIVDATIFSDVAASQFYIYQDQNGKVTTYTNDKKGNKAHEILAIFPNYQDYGYGIFLLDEKSRNYVLANINNEKDSFLRSMMWGALWDSVREAELNPKDYVELAVKNVSGETDELTIQTILSRVSTAMNYYIENESVPPAVAGGSKPKVQPPATAGGTDLAARLEKVLLDRMTNAETLGQRVIFYRAFLNLAASETARQKLKDILSGKFEINGLKLKTKDKFDLVTRLLILNDADAPQLLTNLEKAETSDEAKRYAYAARAGIASPENKRKYFEDFLNNKDLSESYIETAVAPFNSIRHAETTVLFLEKALAELPNLKRSRKIFFVNNWLGAFIGGQKSEQALAIVNKFLADNPNLDRDLRLKVLENVDGLERAVKIRRRFAD